MATIVWDEIGDRVYEIGVSKGVLYKADRTGVPWNGLTSIEETNNNSVDPVYFDGTKFSDIVTVGDFSATMKAFTYPDEFLVYEGNVQDQQGFYITNQPPTQFGLSYQTKIGNDVSGPDDAYKIHLLYNLTAIPSSRSFESINDSIEPVEFEWSLTSIPEHIDGLYPTAHVILDSRKLDPFMLIDIEDILYGTEEEDARLPTLKALSTFIRSWNRFIITTDGHGHWTAYSRDPSQIVMTDATTFEITTDTAEYIDADTYTITSSDKDEGDIWLP